ncbi:hypothetical protein LOCC1_G003937 [Lachnellula occidentalis]|uniref:Zn(2)-C6 fungal-type domain-containing protein n=1 Tax=Lachnellula occidentalis TaxID=215460 RepID=A0A8H8UGQ8_9HELO|nr:hypothetical protein LOCC1_G003937 [Lachnellula occidentalis]
MSYNSSQPGPTPLDLGRVKQSLKRKAELLEGFLLDRAPSAEGCRILHQRIGIVENEIAKAGITEAANNWLKLAGFDAGPPLSPTWIGENRLKTMFLPATRPVQMGAARPMDPKLPTSKKRPHIIDLESSTRAIGCGEDLGRRQTPNGGNSKLPPIQQLQKETQRLAFALYVFDGGPHSTHPGGLPNFPLALNATPVAASSQPSKRMKLAPEESYPCLRCKILKKKCDSLPQCAHCPQKSCDSGNDYWKVLGCFRGPLKDLSSVFCPDFARSPSRTLKLASGGFQTVDFMLFKSTVSATKKKRILRLIKSRDDFSKLANTSWENLDVRGSLCKEAASSYVLNENVLPGETLLLEEYETAWAVLQAVAMDAKYLGRTEYNFFKLIQLGNRAVKRDPESWEIFRKSKVLLRQAVEIYLLESLCRQIALGTVSGPPPFLPSRLPASKALVLVDIKDDLEKFLSDFEAICSGRAKLAGPAQFSCLYALLVFSIVQSVLIDAYATRSQSDYVDPWNESYALRITSGFKALVGVFTSSSKADVILQNESSVTPDSSRNAFRECREMVHLDKWEERGFKSTKDFLLNLGSCAFSDGIYNGFFVQKFGLETIPKYQPTSPSRKDTTISENGMLNTFSVVPTSTSISRRDQSPNSTKTLSPEPVNSTRMARSPSNPCSTEPKNASFSTFTFVGHGEGSKRDHCHRRGPLDQSTFNKAKDVRRVGACWNCWLMKVPCSLGDPCDRCEKILSPSPLEVCSRAPLTTHTGVFFPDFLHSHLDAIAINTYINDNVSHSIGSPFLVEVTWIGDKSIKLLASAFVSYPQARAQQNYQARSGQSLGVESLPVGFLPLDDAAVKKACLAHFELILEKSSFPKLLTGCRSPLSRQILETICGLYQVKKHLLLHDVLLFYLIIHTMERPILFTKLSAATIIGKLDGEHPQSQHYSSRLLNRQVKRVIYQASVELLRRVLRQLEKFLRSRQGSTWSICFATFLILCLCLEQVQVQAEAHITTLKSTSLLPEHLNEEPQRCCESMDRVFFSQLVPIFHSVYRTHNGGLNPLSEHPSPRLDEQPDESAMAFVKKIRCILLDGNLLEHNKLLRFDELFAQNNSGRLVSKFLITFTGRKSGPGT